MFAFQLALNTNISIKNEVSGKWYESKWYNSNAFQECSLSPNKFALIRGLQIFINLKKHNSYNQFKVSGNISEASLQEVIHH